MRVLTARERQKLKARAHALEPAVQVGQHGMTEQLAKELDRALAAHQMIKVKVTAADHDAREGAVQRERGEGRCGRGAACQQGTGAVAA